MQLTVIDLIVIALYFAINLAVALFLRKRATKSVSDFFISGRNVSWWLAGTSMVATTFAADTPLVVTGLVARNGIAGNWIWWSMAFSGMLTVFFFAKLWRRAGVLTDVEFAEIRYSGKPAKFLRWFRAVYLGLPINLIILGWVNLAIVKIMMLVLGVSKIEALMIAIGIMFITASISTLSGLWGVLWTDLFQFVLKMGMVILLAVFAVNATGGMGEMVSQLHTIDADAGLAGVDTIVRPGPELCLDAAYHILCLHCRQLVGVVVSGSRTGRRRVRCPANIFRKERETFASRHSLVQRGALCDSPMAMDSRRTRGGGPLPARSGISGGP